MGLEQHRAAAQGLVEGGGADDELPAQFDDQQGQKRAGQAFVPSQAKQGGGTPEPVQAT